MFDQDHLTQIRGIDSAIEAKLYGLHVIRFEQIAQWKAEDIARISHALGEGSQINAENWIEQAAILASGRATHFSSELNANGEREDSGEGVTAQQLPRQDPQFEDPEDPEDPDDLTQIRNIDNSLARALRAQGIISFAHIASLIAEDMAALDQLLFLDNKICAENWIEQAAILILEKETAVDRMKASGHQEEDQVPNEGEPVVSGDEKDPSAETLSDDFFTESTLPLTEGTIEAVAAAATASLATQQEDDKKGLAEGTIEAVAAAATAFLATQQEDDKKGLAEETIAAVATAATTSLSTQQEDDKNSLTEEVIIEVIATATALAMQQTADNFKRFEKTAEDEGAKDKEPLGPHAHQGDPLDDKATSQSDAPDDGGGERRSSSNSNIISPEDDPITEDSALFANDNRSMESTSRTDNLFADQSVKSAESQRNGERDDDREEKITPPVAQEDQPQPAKFQVADISLRDDDLTKTDKTGDIDKNTGQAESKEEGADEDPSLQAHKKVPIEDIQSTQKETLSAEERVDFSENHLPADSSENTDFSEHSELAKNKSISSRG